MRRRYAVCAALGLLAWSPSASAQNFGNQSFSMGAGFIKFFVSPETIDYAVPLTGGWARYLDAGHEIFVTLHPSIVHRQVGVTAGGGGGFVFAGLVQAGWRYLFSEESVRPYVGAHLAGLAVWPGPSLSFGPGANGGIEWFVSDAWSFGPRVFVDCLVLDLNAPVRVNLGLSLQASAHF